MQIVNKFIPADRISVNFLADCNHYIRGQGNWQGKFVVQHNTSSPTLAMRPQGLTEQHILNLKSYYEGLGWHAGPHCFVDDNGVWEFSPLSAPGVHSPSWNSVSYGVEMLGDYDTESFTEGRGLLVQRNAVAVIACISHVAGIDSHSMREHWMDPKTTHKNCPGKNATAIYDQFMDDVHTYITAHLPTL